MKRINSISQLGTTNTNPQKLKRELSNNKSNSKLKNNMSSSKLNNSISHNKLNNSVSMSSVENVKNNKTTKLNKI